ncbi:hypothetical protein [Cohnella thermotolerans]|uniref:hypothetical protein n=1 Tax=Cohnella thermotolerans TaxID=329858 RepID=UPI0012EC58BE|nr:hypothetical protein [Cohnella thermotolerans]
MNRLDSNAIDRITAALKGRGAPALTPGSVWHPGLDREIAQIPSGTAPDRRQDVHALAAALHLWNDSLEAAHEIVQLFEHYPTCNLVHAIVHRREGDYANAKYWFRRVGAHPSYPGLQARASRLLGGTDWSDKGMDIRLASALSAMAAQGDWNPYLFAEAVAIQESLVGDDAARAVLESLQLLELEGLVRYINGLLLKEGQGGDRT